MHVNSYASQTPQQQYPGFPFVTASAAASSGPAAVAPFGALDPAAVGVTAASSVSAVDPSAAAALVDMAAYGSAAAAAAASAPEHSTSTAAAGGSDSARGRDKELVYSYAFNFFYTLCLRVSSDCRLL